MQIDFPIAALDDDDDLDEQRSCNLDLREKWIWENNCK